QPSLSHRSFQLDVVTASPNQWCEYSWSRYSSNAAASSFLILPPSVIICWVSMPDAESTITMPPVANGYGPNRFSRNVRNCGDLRSDGTSLSSVPTRYQ